MRSSAKTRDSIALAMVSRGSMGPVHRGHYAELVWVETALQSAIERRPWLTREVL